jgi:signal transduction histidine kinase
MSILHRASSVQNPSEALQHVKAALQFEGRVDDSLRSVIYLRIGIEYSRLYVNDSAEYFFNKAMDFVNESGNKWPLLRANIYNYLGNTSRSLSNGGRAMSYYNMGLTALSGIASREARLLESKLLGNIGGVYYDLNDYSKALEYAERGRDVSLRNELTEHYQMDHLLVGFAARAAGQYDKALENNRKALDLMLFNKDSSYLAHTYYNVASLFEIKGDNDNAIENFDKAMLFAKLFSEHEVLISCLISKSKILTSTGQIREARTLAMEAEKQSVAHTFLPKLIEALDIHYQIMKRSDEYKSATQIQDTLLVLRDSLYRLDTRKSINELETRYETAKKEQTIKDLEQQNEIKDLQVARDRQTRYGLIVVAGLLVIVVALYYNRFRLKQRTAEALSVKNTQLQEANYFRDRLFAVVSHDLKSPLSAFQTLTSSLDANVHLISPEQLQAFVAELNSSSRQILDILNNLLAWAISQTGHLGYRPSIFSPARVSTDVVAQLSSAIKLKQLNVDLQIANDFVAYGDPALVQIVIRNLVANAIKFSSTGTTILLAATRMSEGVLFTVRDQGIGMDDEDVNKLFRINQDMASIGNSTEKGTGIGLLLCFELITRHKGRIWAESVAGKGSSFYFTLPDGNP